MKWAAVSKVPSSTKKFQIYMLYIYVLRDTPLGWEVWEPPMWEEMTIFAF